MKNNAAATEKQIDNPVVSITYAPQKALEILGHDSLAVLGQLQGSKITNVKTLEAASEVLHDGEVALERIAECREAFAVRVREAFEPFKKLPVFQEAAINITLTIPLRQQLDDAVRRLKSNRAQYLADEQQRLQQEQLKKDAEQRRINEEAAKKAAVAAKAAGANKETVAEIKQEVLATLAPLVESRVADVAQSVGASVRYMYKAEVTNLKQFLGACLQNPVLFNTLKSATAEIEDSFNKMAGDQKEAFKYPGITYKKIPVDVSRKAGR